MSTNYFSNYIDTLSDFGKTVKTDAKNAKDNAEVPELIKICLDSFALSVSNLIQIAANNSSIEKKYNNPNAGIKEAESNSNSDNP